MNSYLVPAQERETEIQVSNSRFITGIKPVFSTSEAESHLEAVRAQYPDATHHVPAFVIGHGSSVIAHSSDDGEPSGTAGRPALSVLQGSDLGDTSLVITRYYGGTKLGTGGLVKAYGESARTAIAAVPKALKIFAHELEGTLDYSTYERAQREINRSSGKILQENFGAQVELTFQLPVKYWPAFQDFWKALTRGQGNLRVTREDIPALIPPPGGKESQEDN